MARRFVGRIAVWLGMAVVTAVFSQAVWSEEPATEDTGRPPGEAERPTGKVRMLRLKVFPMAEAGAPRGPVLSTRAELEKFVGRRAAAELAPQVDFDTEDVVAVQYETAGPPFGTPGWEFKGEGEQRRVEFFVVEPFIAAGEARGRALKLGLDFFAVPKGTPVKILDVKRLPKKVGAT